MKKNKIKIVITSGPMEMKIDRVRAIENTSSGMLGSMFANKLSQNGMEVIYVHTKNAKLPVSEQIKKVEISNQAELLQVLKNELPTADICIHAMAVRDFNFGGILKINQVVDTLLAESKNELKRTDIETIIADNIVFPEKLSSAEKQLIIMEPGIKVVDEIKKINPSVKLVSFKLLSNVSEDELVQVAKNQLKRTKSQLVVANLMENVSNDAHKALLINENEIIGKCYEKKAIVDQVIKYLI